MTDDHSSVADAITAAHAAALDVAKKVSPSAIGDIACNFSAGHGVVLATIQIRFSRDTSLASLLNETGLQNSINAIPKAMVDNCRKLVWRQPPQWSWEPDFEADERVATYSCRAIMHEAGIGFGPAKVIGRDEMEVITP